MTVQTTPNAVGAARSGAGSAADSRGVADAKSFSMLMPAAAFSASMLQTLPVA